MAVTATPYRNVVSQSFQGKVAWSTDTVKCALVTSSYTPNFDTDTFWSTPQANETTGTGYTAGGTTLGSKTFAYTTANSWGVQWAATTAYVQGQIVRPGTGNGHLYRCIIGGTSGGSTPTFPTTVGTTVTDNTITWEECGSGITVLGCTSPSWSSSTITAAYAVFYDAQSGSAASEPLIAAVNFGGNVSSTNGTFQVTVDPNLGVIYFTTQ